MQKIFTLKLDTAFFFWRGPYYIIMTGSWGGTTVVATDLGVRYFFLLWIYLEETCCGYLLWHLGYDWNLDGRFLCLTHLNGRVLDLFLVLIVFTKKNCESIYSVVYQELPSKVGQTNTLFYKCSLANKTRVMTSLASKKKFAWKPYRFTIKLVYFFLFTTSKTEWYLLYLLVLVLS